MTRVRRPTNKTTPHQNTTLWKVTASFFRLTNTNLMAVRESALCLERPVEDAAPDVEHGRLLVLTREKVVKRIVGAVGSVVESVADRLGLRYAGHVWGYS